MKNPTVSIILPVYNGAQWIKASILSVLNQSFNDYELIVIDDGSTDNSDLIIQDINDSRIRLLKQSNKGLAATLNIAIKLSNGELVARQDQDDISFPQRIQKQVDFLNANPEIGMVGSSAEIWRKNIKTDRLLKHPLEDALLKFNLLFDNPFVHSSVMIRRSVFARVGGYSEDKSRQPPEDYELWSRISKKYKVGNLEDVLLAYHEVPGSMSRTGLNPFLIKLIRISAENLAWYSGRDIDSPALVATSMLAHGVYTDIPNSAIKFSQIEAIVIEAANSIIQKSNLSSTVLDELIKMRISMLKYHYYQYKTNGLLEKFVGTRLERYIRAAARRILEATSR